MISIFAYNGQIHIRANDGKISANGTMQVIDMLGRVVYSAGIDASGQAVYSLSIPAGYYLVSVRTPETVTNQKVYIR